MAESKSIACCYRLLPLTLRRAAYHARWCTQVSLIESSCMQALYNANG